MKREIKVKFTGFWSGFQEDDNFILNILSRDFHVILSEDPDYLFYSVFNDDFIKYDCVRIFITGENVCPDFQMCDYAIGFEHLEFGDRYLRCPFYYFVETYQEDLEAAQKKHLGYLDKLSEKTEFCSFVYSNSDADEMRTQIYEAINGYKKINSGGRIFNSYGGKRVDSKRDFEAKHKFSIACENSSHKGYTTEKILQSFAAGTVPIYWGNTEVGKDFNKAAFIDANDFSSLGDLVSYIEEVDRDPELYQTYLREPAFPKNVKMEDMQNQVKEFLLSICTQEPEKAFRRSRVFWGRTYQRRYWVYKRSYGVIKKLKKILGKRFAEKIEGHLYE